MPYPMIPARSHGGTQSYVLRIVIHATVSPCVRGGARANARWFQNPAAGVSAHYVVDPGEVVQCLPENVVGYHDGKNVNEIGIELCDPQAGPFTRWRDADHEAMLRRAAQLVREVAGRWQFPRPLARGIAPLSPNAEVVCGHHDISLTWRCSTHTDPGPDFPWDHFMTLVNEGEEDDMPSVEEIADAVHDRIWKDQWTDPLTGRQQEAWQFLRQAPPLSWMQQRFSDLWQQALANDADAIAEKVAAKAAGGQVTKEIVQDAIRELVNGKEN